VLVLQVLFSPNKCILEPTLACFIQKNWYLIILFGIILKRDWAETAGLTRPAFREIDMEVRL